MSYETLDEVKIMCAMKEMDPGNREIKINIIEVDNQRYSHSQFGGMKLVMVTLVVW